MLSNSGWRAASASLMNFAPGRTASPDCFVEEAERDRYVAGRLRNRADIDRAEAAELWRLCRVAQGHHSLTIGVTASRYDVGSYLSKSPT